MRPSAIQGCDPCLGVVVADDKTEGPSTRLTVLGIEFDTEAMVLRLPQEKLERQRSLLATWRGWSSYLRRELESLAGVLQHASKVVRPGRSFMRRIYDLLAQTQHFKPHFRVRLNSECQADIEWWSTFSQYWNGIYVHYATHPGPKPRCPSLVRCIRFMGLWGFLAGTVVPSGMEVSADRYSKHCTKRIFPNPSGLRNLGPLLEGLHCVRPLRQYRSC